MTCSAQLKAFFPLIIVWDVREAGCDVGERPGEKCHPEETGEAMQAGGWGGLSVVLSHIALWI